MPKQYTKGNTLAFAQLLVRDNNNDGTPEFAFTWSGIGTAGKVAASWDGTQLVPNKPIPRIAAMAASGAFPPGGDQLSYAGSDRWISAIATRRLTQLVTTTTLAGTKAVYKRGTAYKLGTPFNAADYALAVNTYQARVEQNQRDIEESQQEGCNDLNRQRAAVGLPAAAC
jgi:hypothetical protein